MIRHEPVVQPDHCGTRARRLGVNPQTYLREVLEMPASTTAEQLDALLPDKWKARRPAASAGTATPSPTPDRPLQPRKGNRRLRPGAGTQLAGRIRLCV